MSLTVLDPGLHSLLVDTGRPSSRSLGVPVGGAADRFAFAIGNALLGNDPAAVALEITLAGPTLRAEHRTAAVIFGAPFAARIEGRRDLTPGETFALEPGDVLRTGGAPEGVRAYLCVAGGFSSPEILGSRSGLEPVKKGDVLPCPTGTTPGRSLVREEPGEAPGFFLRCLPGVQYDLFLQPERFTAGAYEVTPASNRMGLRLNGERLERRPGELTSEPVAPGAVQITNDGMPVVLGVDGQTIGGYPKIAHVIRADLDRLAQLRPGTTVTFQFVTPEEVELAARDCAASLGEWLARLSTVVPPGSLLLE
ncbi:MAG TPA: biotin-dependent carboxyltransferase family protein [Fimbriiglobus sp.]|jgi:antagonist of KipI